MNYKEALDYIHSNFWQGSKPGLSRTENLLNLLGNPQDQLKFVHVAGTNGKGSFCAMLSSILIESGLKVGCYTSPYILRFNERMKINGVDIPDETLADLTEYVRPLAEEMEEKPTEFELITAIAMEYFAREKCDIVVLECGMGGRLDSTNVIKTPLISVITGIALDHTSFLGNTISEIAKEKAGIIKENVPVLYCGKDAEAEKVILDKAKECNSPYHRVERVGLNIKNRDLNGTEFSYLDMDNLSIPLLGTYQTDNAQNVLEAVNLLKNEGLTISEDAILKGLKKVKWPARFEKVNEDPLMICDGGHNPEGVDSAIDSVKCYFNSKKLIVVTGVMADKDYPYMVKRISEIAEKVYCLKPENPRALSAEDLAAEFQKSGIASVPCSSTKEAVNLAYKMGKETKTPILSVGSLYMYGEVIAALNEMK